MTNNSIIITGCDSNFFDFLMQCTDSLLAAHADAKADMGILDLGLNEEHLAILAAKGFIIRKPVWPDYVPVEKRIPHMVGLTARTELREYFPGYKTYLWFDADAWAQTGEFIEPMLEGAKASGIAIIRENGANYSRDFVYNKWLYGNMILCYGIIDGIRASFKPSINIGIIALSDTAPHWQLWTDYYKRCIEKTAKINMDQHAFNAMVEIEGASNALMPTRYNWIPTLSTPSWNNERKMLCEPDNIDKPLSVIHLAGPDKARKYQLKTGRTSEIFESALTYRAVCAHKQD